MCQSVMLNPLRLCINCTSRKYQVTHLCPNSVPFQRDDLTSHHDVVLTFSVVAPGQLREPERRGHGGPEQPPELLAEDGCDPCSDFSNEEPLGDLGVKAVRKEAPGAR